MLKKKYFGTDGIRGRVGTFPIDSEFTLKLGWAVGKVFTSSSKNKKLEVLIGKDTRISGYVFEAALQSGLISSGANIHLAGPLPTPAIAYLTKTLNMDVGIVISASHNLFSDNGIKFFNRNGYKITDEEELMIEQMVDIPMNMVSSEDIGRAYRVRDARGRYIEFCKSTFPIVHGLDKIRIVLDCANGAGYDVAPKVFSELGAEVIVINDEPDGLNINKDCGSTSPESLISEVIRRKADVGIALDGDGDRVLMVDEAGAVLDGDDVLFAIYKYLSLIGKRCEGVVGTLMSNFGLEQEIINSGSEFIRVGVGDRNISAKLRETGWELGGESSGHILCDKRVTTGDGIIAALQVLACMIEMKVNLSSIRKIWERYPSELINVERSTTIVPNIDSELEEFRRRLGSGRIVVRPSGTEPKTRILVESKNQILNREIAAEIAELIRKRTH